MKIILLLLFPIILFGEASFITPQEYATRLYKNPRGIGCNKCHGEYGEGKVIAHYIFKGKDKIYKGPMINTLNFQQFYDGLQKRNKGMPHYFLTKKEIKALFFYVTKYTKHKEKNEK
ncbi:hypothetical protein MNB_SM-3-707 [hydrothermal vent metagenome]|uniref:Cytochrome c domain-containing protein n=1 Tax=hydrothermal vent metagenome TaxID=652676 RepID=A0A1W1D4H3_9ZZZZ